MIALSIFILFLYRYINSSIGTKLSRRTYYTRDCTYKYELKSVNKNKLKIYQNICETLCSYYIFATYV